MTKKEELLEHLEASKDSKELPWWGRILVGKLIKAVEKIDEQEESV